jgi:O-methyltransferase
MPRRLMINVRVELDRIRRKLTAPAGAAEAPLALPQDFSNFTRGLVKRCKPYTMTSVERLAVLEQAIRHICRYRIEGAVVECGVGLGGSMMAAAYVLRELGETEREIYLFDTFSGMPEPTDEDLSIRGKKAIVQYRKRSRTGKTNWICYSREDVEATMERSGYDFCRLHLIKGMVEDTLPPCDIDRIALLRLDTDWYNSTRAEMRVLYPKLAPGGLLIVDDYNRWLGSRKAVDEYLAENGVRMFLARVDDHAVVGVKPG